MTAILHPRPRRIREPCQLWQTRRRKSTCKPDPTRKNSRSATLYVRSPDHGFASAPNRSYLPRGGGHYIHAEKLRHTNTQAAAALARAGRYHQVAGNLRVKEVHVAPGGKGDGDDGVRTERFLVCHNPDQADRDAQVRANLSNTSST